ncbi:carbohydrate ABC transporter permease [Pseudoroseicyclus aestuarii]|uniref:Alpha-glucoside transport system permease protein n=1 Tax=Pseudoroseicyclus aestuarii TaxID=1795041 RepID=A0A318SXH8_9RHOB|nr:sugar ABC transporter permease [Pseudoroseicyclus aestuarii]PYE86132.1 alpha-glucoside transport system permease protein [Pseudoroseicyclus aestuarii]
MNPVFQGVLAIAVAVAGCGAYFYLSNLFLDRVLYPPTGRDPGRNVNRANAIRPWLFLAPAILFLALYLGYPVIETLRLSVTDRVPGGFVWAGFDNYAQMSRESKFWEAFRNNLLWLIVVPAVSTALGLLVAQLTDRISWGNVAKSLIFMPMAISFVGASVIFKLIYDYRPASQEQIGVLNAVWLQFDGGLASVLVLRVVPGLLLAGFIAAAAWLIWAMLEPVLLGRRKQGALSILLRAALSLGALFLIWRAVTSIIGLALVDLPYGQPQTWLTIPFWNNFFLMVVLIWIQTGFAMVLLSAALRGIPDETVEAAIVDGAGPFQIFFRIKVPQIAGTIAVVWTTITVTVLKVFDIVYAMTNGQWETQVLANYMYDKLFRSNDWGVGSAAAIVIMLLVTPILVWNIYNARREMR